ncbi:MAG: ribosome small subunit-dependent GTPase A [Firmicutes bacterium HGW-Firmicutes-1]|jgi:ribosome biogenesis GTPase|nr:MAG: ribosome small subunit-dependent GTPase A [Firmicutes bacterium HGW-Firmicutes-1]
MEGKIIKGIAGFYYVHVPGDGVYECKARGLFRNQNIKPLIGDNVVIDILTNEEKKGNILEIKTRENQLIRPTVANIGQVLIVFSVNHPKPNVNLLDRFLIMVERENIPASICFNKIDTLNEESTAEIKVTYERLGYPVFTTSAKLGKGIEGLVQALYNTTTVFAGPSGVGKSSLLNLIQKEIQLETGEISQKAQRGKHTTRHAELICFKEDSYVVDTPGFSSLSLDELMQDELKNYFVEFTDYSNSCKYQGCNHLNEPHCAVKNALQKGEISESRYNNYVLIYQELKDIRRW